MISGVPLSKVAALCRMKMLQTMFAVWPEEQRKKVAVWVKQQVLENSFNCTTATSGSTGRKATRKVPKKLCETSNPSQSSALRWNKAHDINQRLW